MHTERREFDVGQLPRGPYSRDFRPRFSNSIFPNCMSIFLSTGRIGLLGRLGAGRDDLEIAFVVGLGGQFAAQASETDRVRCSGLVGKSWAFGSADVNPVLGNQSFRLGRMRLQNAGWVSSELGRRSNFSVTHG